MIHVQQISHLKQDLTISISIAICSSWQIKNISLMPLNHIFIHLYICMQTHMVVSHIFHTAQTDQYPRTYPLILTYSYISRRWDKWNEVFQGDLTVHSQTLTIFHCYIKTLASQIQKNLYKCDNTFWQNFSYTTEAMS